MKAQHILKHQPTNQATNLFNANLIEPEFSVFISNTNFPCIFELVSIDGSVLINAQRPKSLFLIGSEDLVRWMKLMSGHKHNANG